MQPEINLIPEKVVIKRSVRRIFVASALFLTFVCFVSIAFLLYHFILKATALNLDQQKQQLSKNIESLSSKKLNLLLVHERLFSINKIINTRGNVNNKMMAILKLLPEKVTVDNIEGSRDEIAVSIASADLEDFDNLLEERLKIFSDPTLQVKRVDVSSFRFDKNKSQYFLSLHFFFNK